MYSIKPNIKFLLKDKRTQYNTNINRTLISLLHYILISKCMVISTNSTESLYNCCSSKLSYNLCYGAHNRSINWGKSSLSSPWRNDLSRVLKKQSLLILSRGDHKKLLVSVTAYTLPVRYASFQQFEDNNTL